MTTKTSDFWKRLTGALREQHEPTSQGAVGGLCRPKVSQPSVYKWKSGEGLPTLDNAIQLAKKANVPVEWLLTGRGPKRLAPSATDPALSELLDLWGLMDQERRTWLLQTAKMARTVSFNGNETKREITERRLARPR